MVNGKSDINDKPGDLVQIEGDGSRLKWKTAIIEEVARGNDGVPRSATLRTVTGRTTRPLAKLYPLELCVENSDNSDENTQKQRLYPGRISAVKAKEKIKTWTNSD